MTGDFDPEEMLDRALREQTRRHFFADCGVGLGAMALASLLAGERPAAHGGGDAGAAGAARPPIGGRARPRSAGGPAGPSSRAGQERHLPVHGRRAEPARAVRLQARSSRSISGQPIPDSFIQGRRFAFMDIFTKEQPKLLGTVRKFAQARPVGGVGLGALAAPGRGGRRPGVRPVGGDRRLQPRAGQAVRQHRARRSSAGRAWARGSPTGSAASRPTCPASSCCSRARAGRAAGRSTGGAASCRSAYQGVPFRAGGEPILNLSTPDGISPRPPAPDDRRRSPT